MANKSVLILGASSDIGWALATKLNTEGYYIMLAGRDEKPLLDKMKSYSSLDYSVHKFDARSFDQHKKWFSALPTIPDITICVFGFLGDQKKAESEWNESLAIIETNYTGAVSILNVVAEQYSKQKKGTIVGISSVAGDRGRQSNFIYGSAKAGFTTYLSGLRNKLFVDGVHVLSVKPGFVDTKMTAGLNLPKILTAKPDQVANSIYKAIAKKKNLIYVLPIWFWIMLAIKNIPEGIFKRMKL